MTPERPRVVFAPRRPPWPLDNGARIRSHRLVAGLADAFEVTLVTYDHPDGSPDGHVDLAALRAALPAVEVVAVPAPATVKRRAQAAGLLGRGSFSFARYARPAYADALRAAAADAALVHFDDLGAALNGPLPGVVNVYSSHNVEQEILRLGARAGSPARRLFNAVEAAKVRREERLVWRTMDLALAVSAADAELMGAGGARRVAVCPNGTDLVAPTPWPALRPGEPLRILFVGSGAYAPYERGLAWFVGEVLPLVRTPATFDVVGQPPSRPVAAPGVSYAGRVPEVGPYYERAHVVVVPVFEGSGTRLKLIEALGHGRPVVSTTLGAAGLPLEPGTHYLQADDAAAFAAAIDRVAAEGPALGPMLAAARAAIEPLAWPSITAELVERYRREIAARS